MHVSHSEILRPVSFGTLCFVNDNSPFGLLMVLGVSTLNNLKVGWSHFPGTSCDSRNSSLRSFRYWILVPVYLVSHLVQMWIEIVPKDCSEFSHYHLTFIQLTNDLVSVTRLLSFVLGRWDVTLWVLQVVGRLLMIYTLFRLLLWRVSVLFSRSVISV